MFLEIEHQLRFEYDDFINESFIELRVEPRNTEQQRLDGFFLAVGPSTRVSRYFDWNGNIVHHFSVTGFHNRIEVLAKSSIETQSNYPHPSGIVQPPPSRDTLGPLIDLLRFGTKTLDTEHLAALDRESGVSPDAAIGSQVLELGAFLHRRFEYRKDVTDFSSTTDDLIEQGGGVCQDFAHVMLGLLRRRGIPCRYVSGYLHVESIQGEPSQSHAWIQAHAPGRGWVAFDPTHNQVPDERYACVGFGREYDDVPPNRGIYKGGAEERLVAAVHTRVTEQKTVAAFHEELGDIDVPVFREFPHRITDDPEARLGQAGSLQQ